MFISNAFSGIKFLRARALLHTSIHINGNVTIGLHVKVKSYTDDLILLLTLQHRGLFNRFAKQTGRLFVIGVRCVLLSEKRTV